MRWWEVLLGKDEGKSDSPSTINMSLCRVLPERTIAILFRVASNLACSKEQHTFAAAEYASHTPGHQRRQRSCQQGS